MHGLRSLLITGICLASSSVVNALAFTNWPAVVIPGEPTTVTWTGLDMDTILTLRKGTAGDLHDVKTITDVARGGTFTWTPEPTLEDGTDYAFQIKQNGDVNYSGHFTVAGSRDQRPQAVGPPPPRLDPHSPEFDTSPKDNFGQEGVSKGNDGSPVSLGMSDETGTAKVGGDKKSVDNAASVGQVSVGFMVAVGVLAVHAIV
ncbi:hypothetical protein FE257_007894 [Aspergillus nanangensis]|uniref:Yeast cell wall synthesis Kre9/Knh1-like N-terminal domain-containing protein n=1 Tax=Aspergillus nanangensis TaxID=2582783 RepID=A0AAD4CX81_ASPNN|nr:hypothetical protein FE257_007894 [Aspergillus nanangensis]